VPGTYYYYCKVSTGNEENPSYLYSDVAAVTAYSFPINKIELFWDDEPVNIKLDWHSWDAPLDITVRDEGSAGNYQGAITIKKTGPGQVWAVNYNFPEPKDFSSLANPTDDDPNDRDRATDGYFHMLINIEKSATVTMSAMELYTPDLIGSVSDHLIMMLPYLGGAEGGWYEINKPLTDLDVTNGYDGETGLSSKDGLGDWSNVAMMRLWFLDDGSLNSIRIKDAFIYR
jgi:hypothetical protein